MQDIGRDLERVCVSHADSREFIGRHINFQQLDPFLQDHDSLFEVYLDTSQSPQFFVHLVLVSDFMVGFFLEDLLELLYFLLVLQDFGLALLDIGLFVLIGIVDPFLWNVLERLGLLRVVLFVLLLLNFLFLLLPLELDQIVLLFFQKLELVFSFLLLLLQLLQLHQIGSDLSILDFLLGIQKIVLFLEKMQVCFRFFDLLPDLLDAANSLLLSAYLIVLVFLLCVLEYISDALRLV